MRSCGVVQKDIGGAARVMLDGGRGTPPSRTLAPTHRDAQWARGINGGDPYPTEDTGKLASLPARARRLVDRGSRHWPYNTLPRVLGLVAALAVYLLSFPGQTL